MRDNTLSERESQIVLALFALTCCYQSEAAKRKSDILKLIKSLKNQDNMQELARFMLLSFNWDNDDEELSKLSVYSSTTYLQFFSRLTSNDIQFSDANAAINSLANSILLYAIGQKPVRMFTKTDVAPEAEPNQVAEVNSEPPNAETPPDAEPSQPLKLDREESIEPDSPCKEWEEIEINKSELPKHLPKAKKNWISHLFSKASPDVPENEVAVNWHEYIAGASLTKDYTAEKTRNSF